jgi:RNA polymerase sigma factor (sigma-70 family)
MYDLTERLRRLVRWRGAVRQNADNEVMAAQQRLERVKAALAQLPARCREVFLMHRTDGMSYSRIAARVGMSVSDVENHIARACWSIDAHVNGEHTER